MPLARLTIRLLRQKAVAELLGVSERTLERGWRLKGAARRTRKWAGGRLVAYARSDVPRMGRCPAPDQHQRPQPAGT